MARKQKTPGMALIWMAIACFALAALIDVWAFFSDNYGRNLLYSVPFWAAGIGCFAWLGKTTSGAGR
ncbi:MAG: hypothetical protein Q4P36_06600 [Bowdeniella nasicola]|nr:hypothetical protein [Bowdeniella nasicola]